MCNEKCKLTFLLSLKQHMIPHEIQSTFHIYNRDCVNMKPISFQTVEIILIASLKKSTRQ